MGLFPMVCKCTVDWPDASPIVPIKLTLHHPMFPIDTCTGSNKKEIEKGKSLIQKLIVIQY